MMIFWRRSLVMLSVPKTGTHSYIDHLQDQADIVFKHPQNMKHMGLRKFTRRVLPVLSDTAGNLDYFAFIRHPSDWLWSWYSYRSRPEIKNRPSSTAGITFSDFIRAHLEEHPPAYASVGRQSSLIESTDPPFMVNNLYKYDNKNAANQYLSERLGVSVSPEKMLNKSPALEKNISRQDLVLLEMQLAKEFELYALAK